MKFDTSYLLSGKYAKWICVALISFLSMMILSECLSVRFSDSALEPVIESSNKPVIKVKKDNFKYIAKASLFGVQVTQNVTVHKVKKTLLNLTLVGILFADKIEESQAIISTPNGEAKNYKIGDVLPGDALLKRITANGVLVLREGNLESLSLPKDELRFEPVPEPLKEE